MRIIVRHALPWGNYSTQAIEIEQGSDTTQLQQKVEDKFSVKRSKQILKFKRDGLTVKIVGGWDLEFFGLKDRDIIYLEDIDDKKDKGQAKQSMKMKGGYFAKLGILSKIEEEDDDEDVLSMAQKKKAFNTSVLSDAISDTQLSGGEELDGQSKDMVKKKTEKLKETLDKLIKLSKDGKAEEVGQLLKSYIEDEEDEVSKTTSLQKLINYLSSSGWNSLHYSIFLNNNEVAKKLLENGADPNCQSNDGWTPLQLAVHKNNGDMMKQLIKQQTIKINQVTERGSALHIAAKNGKPEIISLLLENDADISIKNNQGQTAYEVTSSEKGRQIMEKYSLQGPKDDKFRPPKPPIVKGWIYKRGEYLMRMNRRYMVLDPEEGTLIRYTNADDFPNKPLEIIPLKDISNVRRMNAGALYQKSLHYIQMVYHKRYILACNNEDCANKWVTYILQGIVYSTYMDQKFKESLLDFNDSGSSMVRSYNNSEKKVEELLLNDDKPSDNIKDKSFKEDKNTKNGKATEEKKSSDGDLKNGSHDNSKKEKSLTTTTAPKVSKQNKKVKESPAEKEELAKLVDDKVSFQSFEIVKELGSGAFGKVYKVIKKDTGKEYAMKALKKRNLILKNQLKYAITECNVLKNSNSPFVLKLYYAFQTPQYLYMVIDLCTGGDLSLHLARKIAFTEDEARFYVAELVLAIEHLHSFDVLYRDLKPENILLDTEGHIRLADFGLSKENVGDGDTARSFCGSPAYLSPEMLRNKGVGKAADIYGVGTVLYEMVVGSSPYYNDDIPKMYQNIRKAKLPFPEDVSEECRNLVVKLLNRDPNTRIGVKDKNEIKNDPFFKSIDWEKLAKKEIEPPKFDPLDDEDEEPDLHFQPGKVHTDWDYEEKNKSVNRVRKFTFIRSDN